MTQTRLRRVPSKYRSTVETELGRLGKRIQIRREKLGLTQEELAEELGISSIFLQFIEQGRRLPSLPLLMVILKYLKMDLIPK